MTRNTDVPHARIKAETSRVVLEDIEVRGRIVPSDGAILTIKGDDQLTHKVVEYTHGDGDTLLLKSDNGSLSRNRGVVTDIEVGI